MTHSFGSSDVRPFELFSTDHSNGTNKVIDTLCNLCYSFACILTLSPEGSHRILARLYLSPLSPPSTRRFLTIFHCLLTHLESTLTKV